MMVLGKFQNLHRCYSLQCCVCLRCRFYKFQWVQSWQEYSKRSWKENDAKRNTTIRKYYNKKKKREQEQRKQLTFKSYGLVAVDAARMVDVIAPAIRTYLIVTVLTVPSAVHGMLQTAPAMHPFVGMEPTTTRSGNTTVNV